LIGAPLLTVTDELVDVADVPYVEFVAVTEKRKYDVNAGKSESVSAYVTVFDTAGFDMD
jgi:hypothetical protein